MKFRDFANVWQIASFLNIFVVCQTKIPLLSLVPAVNSFHESSSECSDFEDCSVIKARNLINWHGCVTLPLPGAQHFVYPVARPFSAALYHKETNSKQFY
jgi:hypothetical protein